MENIKEAFEIVFGKDFVDEMLSRLLIIGISLCAVLLLIASIAVWKSVACGKIKKAVLALSEHPDDETAGQFVQRVEKVTAVGKFFARHSGSYAGLSKSDCRTIFNSTVLPSARISSENKKTVRALLMKIGCSGLTDVDSI